MADQKTASLHQLRGMLTRMQGELGETWGRNKQKLVEISFHTLRMMAHRDVLAATR